MESEHVSIGNIQENFDRAEDILETYLFKIGVEGKNKLRFTLLTEEALRLVRSIVANETGIEMWFEGDNKISHIFLQVQGDFDANKKEEFVSVSSSGANNIKPTFFDELRGIFVKPQKATWSLAEYTKELNEKKERDIYAQESWENLERSVIANFAKDIVVSVKDQVVLMDIIKDFSD